jgi:hypothetical protein
MGMGLGGELLRFCVPLGFNGKNEKKSLLRYDRASPNVSRSK